MNKLYIAGDSFASLSITQENGVSWSEILASKLELELVNVAIAGCSNFSIAIQLDWITQQATKDDAVIIMLTDHYRKTLVNSTDAKIDSTPLLLHHLFHHKQRVQIELSDTILKATTIINADSNERDFYKKWFHPVVQEFEDTLVITGALTKLSSVTTNYIVCLGGFGNQVYTDKTNDSITHDTFFIKEHNFLKLSSKQLMNMAENDIAINHMDELLHKKVAALIFRKYSNIL
jgi:hypothetical protein